MKRFSTLLALFLMIALSACGEPVDEPTDEPETMTKEEARAIDGKSDHTDWCDAYHWYGDGICDDFCPNPDPDCGADTCASDADCPDGYCAATSQTCVVAECDDGTSLSPFCDIREACDDGLVSAVQNGCFACVDPRTCEEPEEPEAPSCDDGTSVSPLCDIREACDDGLVSAVQNGCFVCVDPTTCEAPDATGQMCGGIGGLLCPDGYRCEIEPGMCNVADAGGTCVKEADACAQVFDPVCGCDGNTYSNSCMAGLAGISVDHDGECLPDGDDGDCGGFAGLTCEDDEFCAYDESEMCGAADHLGTCMARPEACITLFDPVCGCDGNTYSNSCFAAQAGVSVASEGSCT